MKELKVVEILEEYRSIFVDSSIMGEECGENISDDDKEISRIDEALTELEELTQKINSLEALADNPNIAMTYREFLKAALDGKIDYTPKG